MKPFAYLSIKGPLVQTCERVAEPELAARNSSVVMEAYPRLVGSLSERTWGRFLY